MWYIKPSNYVSAKVRAFYIKGLLQMLYLFHWKVLEEIYIVRVKYREWETSEEEVSYRNKIPVLRITCWYRDSNWSNEVINFIFR